MMKLRGKRWFCTLLLCGLFTLAMPGEASQAHAAVSQSSVGVETSSAYVVKIDAPKAAVRQAADERSAVVAEVRRGDALQAVSYEDGWAVVSTGSGTGYLKVSQAGTLVETTHEKVDPETMVRGQIVEYALQFVGNPYVWGGTDPNVGADCSGFTSYVMRNVAGVSLSHSSRAQAGEGRRVENPLPGDLIFYSNGGRINHVAIYIGDGQIVHASTERTGIKVSNWNYRTPTAIVSVVS